MAKIALTTNTREIEIERNGKVVGSIFFDVTDTTIITRLQAASGLLSIRYNELKSRMHENLPPEDAFGELEKLDKELRDMIDEAFQSKCSDIVFGEGFAFNSHNGITLAEQFIAGAVKYIEEATREEAEAAKKRQEAYLGKYKK